MSIEQAQAILAVQPGASRAELRAARNAGVLQWHPDKNPGAPHGKERFEAIVDAFELLVSQLPKAPESAVREPNRSGVQVRKAATHEAGIDESKIHAWVHAVINQPLSTAEARNVQKQFFAAAERNGSSDIWAIRLLARAMPTPQARRVFLQRACKRFAEKSGIAAPCKDAGLWIWGLENLLGICREHDVGAAGLLANAHKALPHLWPGDIWAENMLRELQADHANVKPENPV